MTVTVSTFFQSYLQLDRASNHHQPETISSGKIPGHVTDAFPYILISAEDRQHHEAISDKPSSTGDSCPLHSFFPDDDPERFFSIRFETSSMVYIPGETEKLDIDTVEIIEGSELANQLGTSGKVRVDKVFYQAGTGAITAQLMINQVEQLFTLFYINVETNIKLPVTQYQLDAYLSETKNDYAPHYEFFKEALKENSSTQVLGTEANPNTEHQWRRKLLRKVKGRGKDLPHYMYPKSMTPVKQYFCNQGVSGVTNKKGIDITEAVKIRMYQQEEKLVAPIPPVRYQNIESALRDIAKHKDALAANQRDASRLNIDFDKPPRITLPPRQAETVKMLSEKRLMAKKSGVDFAADDIPFPLTILQRDQKALPNSPPPPHHPLRTL
ncbi:hypothetical protein [Endozoicomonas sp. SCSIO W0465]|uniref:hypothetical protein n=1 Tax=Endozoicomonas sp. SCSIO W0465 TaxID=2918516 RepID=UPI0020760BC0|nr:hypothetical protein [Endozoicomonas sp. SCSIO W0465]USE33975.1 hypothetical protein MJO57_17580 [Endozoicomonas sp. SCSIO W0465]